MGAEDDRPSRMTGAEDPRGGEIRHRLRLSFDAFDASHHRLWLRYTHTQVGSQEAAGGVVEDACRHLLKHWEQALRQESLAAYAWTVLKEHVAKWLAGQELRPRLAETAASHAGVRKALLLELRDEFSVLEGEMGLYAAIARLPERQYDVIVLRYVLGCAEDEVADCLGFETPAVRSHISYAKRKLARELRTHPGPESGDG